MTSSVETCPVCGAPGDEVASIDDALSPTGRWDLRRCRACSTGWATPLVVPFGYYDAIYSADPPLTGYIRYERLARGVERSSAPLDYLAGQQDVYWAARSFLAGLAPDARVAEIGSGLGYLTAAARAAGHDVEGLDLSVEAVARAAARFGPHYRVVGAPEAEATGGYDAVMSLEVVEHDPDPRAFLERALDLVRPGGPVLLTTPDRDGYADGDRWRTDPPPVHLFWFGRRSMEALARSVGAEVRFIDFTSFNETTVQRRPTPDPHLPSPFLDAELRPLALAGLRERAIGWLDEAPRISAPIRSLVRRRQGPRRTGPISAALGAVFSRA